MKNLYSVILKLFPKILKTFIKDNYFKITGNYITQKILGDEKKYLEIFNQIKNKRYDEIDKFIKSRDYNEIDQNFLEDLALITQVSIKRSDVNYQHGRLIYSILDDYIINSKESFNNFVFVDIGTAKGFSSIIISKCALQNNIAFKIFSFDIIPHQLKMYWNSVADLKGKISREELLQDYKNFTKNINFIKGKTKNSLKILSSTKRINFAFLDGSHEYEDVKFEFSFIKKRQNKGDIIFFDDVTAGHFDGIVKLIDEIKKSKEYEVENINSTEYRGYAVAIKQF